MTEETPAKQTQPRKERLKRSPYPLKMGFVRTQHASPQEQRCVSAILDLLLQFWTSAVVMWWSQNGCGCSACLSPQVERRRAADGVV